MAAAEETRMEGGSRMEDGLPGEEAGMLVAVAVAVAAEMGRGW